MTIKMSKAFIVGLLLGAILVAFNGCATSPVTQEECKALGGDMTVFFREHGGWKCCKVVKIDNKTFCDEVKEKREPREPREPRAGRD